MHSMNSAGPLARPNPKQSLSELVASGRVAVPLRERPALAPPLATARRPASSLVLSERNAEH